MSVKSKMTAIADGIRQLVGVSGTIGVDAMANNINEANIEVENQADLISQISEAITGKGVGSGGDSSTDELWVHIYNRSFSELGFSSITSIGSFAFTGCSSLLSVSLPNVSTIGSNAFCSCSSLTKADFPACKYIDSGAFRSCYFLRDINFPVCESIGGLGAFHTGYGLKSVFFPLCSHIGNTAFAYCVYLQTANFPLCTTINYGAFSNCYSLTSLILAGSTVCNLSGSGAFSSTPIAGYTERTSGVYGSIFVPASLLSSYMTATNWTYFSSRFSTIESLEL